MDVQTLNGFLLAMGELNIGCNHDCTYQAERVSAAGSLQRSVQQHFERHTQEFKDRGGWTVSIAEPDDGKRLLLEKARTYFFQSEFSPTVALHGNSIEMFMQRFWRCCEDAMDRQPFRIFTVEARSSETFIDIVYDQFVLSAGDDHLLIHLGFSD